MVKIVVNIALVRMRIGNIVLNKKRIKKDTFCSKNEKNEVQSWKDWKIYMGNHRPPPPPHQQNLISF